MADYQLNKYDLRVIQGSTSDSILMMDRNIKKVSDNHDNYTSIIQEQTEQLKSLNDKLKGYTQYEETSKALLPQLKILFPEIQTLMLQQALQVNTDKTTTKRYVIIIIGLYNQKRMQKGEMEKFSKWIKTYVPSDSIKIMTATK